MRTVIIEDEETNRKVLETLLKSYCEGILIVGTCGTVEEGIELMDNLQPALVFLDIQLEGGTAFDILEKTKHKIRGHHLYHCL